MPNNRRLHGAHKRNNHAFETIYTLYYRIKCIYNGFSPFIYLMKCIQLKMKRKWRQPFNIHKRWYQFYEIRWHFTHHIRYLRFEFYEMSLISHSLLFLFLYHVISFITLQQKNPSNRCWSYDTKYIYFFMFMKPWWVLYLMAN